MTKNINIIPDESELINKVREQIKHLTLRQQRHLFYTAINRVSSDIREENNAIARKAYHDKRQIALQQARPTNMIKKLALKPGDVVKMANTVDRHGYREIKSIKGNTIVCHQLYGPKPHYYQSSYWVPQKIHGKDDFDRTGVTTRHNVSSVTHYRDDKTFVPFEAK